MNRPPLALHAARDTGYSTTRVRSLWILVVAALVSAGCGTDQPSSTTQQIDDTTDTATGETTADAQEIAGGDAAADVPAAGVDGTVSQTDAAETTS